MTEPKPAEKIGLEKAIDDVLRHMEQETPGTPEFEAMTDQLVKLHAMKTTESPSRVSPDTLATIAANLLGILVIVGHERTNIITSKALSFIMKLR